jgi:hypothetical protein
MLHITNGTAVSLDKTGLPGTIVYWNDVLHEGPVPAGMSLDELSRVRERFLAVYYGLPPSDVSFAARNAAIHAAREQDEVVLWFEHDLYDQLQLLQILDCFATAKARPAKLSLINIDRYLGALHPSELEPLFESRRPVSEDQLETAATAWKAFRAPEPTAIEPFLRAGSTALPFLAGALRRHLEQFPALSNGLSRTERQILELLDSGLAEFAELFRADRDREERIFMGDTTFRCHLRGLARSRRALISEEERGYKITDFGRVVLSAGEDHVKANGINRWLGGVHLREGAPLWRWDAAHSRLVPYSGLRLQAWDQDAT